MAAAKKTPQRVNVAICRPEDPIPEGVGVLFRPFPGPQTQVLLAPEDEILYGGAKAGGKTAAGIVWLLAGNPRLSGLPNPRPSDISYINHPHYRALVLRRNIIDLGDWIDKARRIYEPMGATFRERPLPLFEFPTGAKIVLGHLDDSDTYQKYQGQEFQRLLLEEATLVPDLKSYLMVWSCVRSVNAELRPQTLLTANPGGPGHSWVRDRFVKPKDAKGNLIPPNTTITDPDTGLTRIYIPARLTDNPALMADPMYIKRLMSLPDAERRAFLDGDWDALSGVMFSEFRPNGPLVGEPVQARHVIARRELNPWLNRFIGMDWAYSHEGAAYWGCDNDDRRIHIYREMVVKGRGAESWGAEVALASLPDLRGMESGVITIHLSPDAWDKRNDTRAIADQIAAGVAHVLGPSSTLVLSDEGTENEVSAFFLRLEEQQRFGIVIRKAANQRIAGAAYIRSLLRWWPLTALEVQPFDGTLFLRMLHIDATRAMEYREACNRQESPQTLPGVLIHDCCPVLIEAIASRMRDESKPDDVLKVKEGDVGDDSYDAFRYGVFSHSREQVRSPLKVQMQERLAAVAASHGGELDGNTLVWVARKLEQDYAAAGESGEPINFPRASGRRAKLYAN